MNHSVNEATRVYGRNDKSEVNHIKMLKFGLYFNIQKMVTDTLCTLPAAGFTFLEIPCAYLLASMFRAVSKCVSTRIHEERVCKCSFGGTEVGWVLVIHVYVLGELPLDL